MFYTKKLMIILTILLNNIEDFYKMVFNIFSNIFMFITMTLSICWSFPFIISSLFGMSGTIVLVIFLIIYKN